MLQVLDVKKLYFHVFEIARFCLANFLSILGQEKMGLADALICADDELAEILPSGTLVTGFFQQFAPGRLDRLFAAFNGPAGQGQCDAANAMFVLPDANDETVAGHRQNCCVVGHRDLEIVRNHSGIRQLDGLLADAYAKVGAQQFGFTDDRPGAIIKFCCGELPQERVLLCAKDVFSSVESFL